MQNQEGNYMRPRIIFAELEMGGRRVECSRCHVSFHPHLGNLNAEKFQCGNCTAYLSYRNNSGTRVKCPPCGFFRPLPNMNSLIMLYCGGCDEKIIFEKGFSGVKCAFCKHITNPHDGNCRVCEIDGNFNVVPGQVNRVVPPRVNKRNRTTNAETESSVKNVDVGMRTIKREIE